MIEYPKIEALQAQVDEDQAQIAELTEEVREKQEGQIQSLHKAVEQEQKFNFLSLAGFFTLLTCLISMFHMTTHVQKFNQPQIQRKIISILWMSPIYSVTSFLSLIFPSVEGWMAVIKDFYESYCIYVFLSFLIAVLGEGSRDKAVEVLAKHAGHLDRPTRCLGCLYEPHPDTSDRAKANAVMTQCQIYCLQFTLVRPVTTIISVFVLHREGDSEGDDEDSNNDDEFNDDTYDSNDNGFNEGSDTEGSSDINNGIQKNSTDSQADDVPISNSVVGEETPAESSSGFDPNTSSNGSTGDGGTRTLHEAENRRLRMKEVQTYQSRMLQDEQFGGDDGDAGGPNLTSSIETSANDNGNVDPITPSIAPGGEVNAQFPTFGGDETLAPSTFVEGISIDSSTFKPTIAFDDADPLAPALITGAETFPEPEVNATSIFDYNTTGLDGIFDTNISTTSPIVSAGINDTSFNSSVIVDETKAYFKSPGFAVAMVVNVSIFFAFSGLLKLYHAVRQELLWCRPFPKFLTIKAVVFLTFWQGLAILLWLVFTAGPDDKDNVLEEAHKYQNLLICVEMLLVAISQWCVFPAIEWEPNYVPRKMQTPGIGLSDFVSDVGQIVKNRSGRRKERRIARRKKRGGTSSDNPGLYHTPGFSSNASSQYDGIGHSTADIMVESFEDDFENSNDESDIANDGNQNDVDIRVRKSSYNLDVPNDNGRTTNGVSLPEPYEQRRRLQSDGTGYSPDKDVTDDDLEIL